MALQFYSRNATGMHESLHTESSVLSGYPHIVLTFLEKREKPFQASSGKRKGGRRAQASPSYD